MAADANVPGFRFAGLYCGIKKNERPDLGLIVADGDVPTAAVFTRNRMRAAPVALSAEHVKRGVARAIVVNSGNANACTGDRGAADAAAMAQATAAAIGCETHRVLVASTGIIGQPLPVERIVEAAPRLAGSARADGFDHFARAIMTTDRFEKRASATLSFGKIRARLIGVAKGAGMIAPNMATTLAFVVTDAAVHKTFLREVLRAEVEGTFNAISVDGDTSTNDSLFLMASGAANNQPIDGGEHGKSFRRALAEVLGELARLIVRDGEGAEHVVTIEVRGAENGTSAEKVARRIAASPLVRTAFFGADPNWGRVLAAVGNAGVDVDPRRVDLAVDDVELVRGGVGLGPDAEARAHQVMRRPEYTLRVHLNRGRAEARHITCDLGHNYVKLNADYRS